MKFMTSFDDALKLEGTSVWMKNGYTMPYFPYQAGRIVFGKRMGVIPSAQQLDIKKVIKAMPPDQVDDGISHGARQVFAIFSLPHATDLYATVVGAFDGSQEQYFCEFFSTTTTRTRSTTIGHRTYGPPLTRIRSLQA